MESLSKGRAAQILTKQKRFVHHEAFGYMLRQAQHERVSFKAALGCENITLNRARSLSLNVLPHKPHLIPSAK